MAVGVFGTSGHERDELSPIRLLSDIVHTIPFTFEEVFALFGQFIAQTGKQIDKEVLEDIFDVTLGYVFFSLFFPFPLWGGLCPLWRR